MRKCIWPACLSVVGLVFMWNIVIFIRDHITSQRGVDEVLTHGVKTQKDMRLYVANPDGFDSINRKVYFGEEIILPEETVVLSIGQLGTNEIVATARTYSGRNELLFFPSEEYQELLKRKRGLRSEVYSNVVGQATTNYPWLRP